MTIAGDVAQLIRYPVKSMLGEELDAVEVSQRGLWGDRGWALVHRDSGKIASAKQPRLWREMLTMRARRHGDGVHIGFADGGSVHSDDRDAEAMLARRLGQSVRLTDVPPAGSQLDRAVPDQVLSQGTAAETEVDVIELGGAAPQGTFFDFAPIHLITSATIAEVAARSARGEAEAARYRPNLVLDAALDAFVEKDWVGRRLRLGEHVALKILASTPRCAVPTLVHGELPRNADALRVLAERNRVRPTPELAEQPCAGVYAQVIRGGSIRRGDGWRLE